MTSHRSTRICLSFTLAATICGVSMSPSPLRAATPESPEVKAVIAKAIAYIEQYPKKEEDGFYRELGGACLVGLAIKKNGAENDHPLIKAGVDHVRRFLGSPQANENNYSIGLAIIFLCEVDADEYRGEIERLLQVMLSRQIPGGGWTYPNDPLGDTSQTQYSALAMWIAYHHDFNIPIEAAEKCCNWLIRTQAPAGGFTYKGKDPGNATRVEQDQARITPTMGAAGVGSLIICSEILGFISPKDKNVSGLPTAVKQVQSKTKGIRTDKVDPALLKRAVLDGFKFMSTNSPVQAPTQQYYYMYSLERYQAFKELAEDKFEKEPTWYNGGFQYLQKSQAPDGSWKSDQGPLIDTSFAVLFLLRSAQKTIVKAVLEQGRLSGGQGLPKDLTNIQIGTNGKVVKNEFGGSIDDVLKMLEDPNNPQGDFLTDAPEEVSIEKDPKKRAAQLNRLRRLAVSGSFQARLTSVKSLSKVRDMDNVPALIFALSDPDLRIVYEARMGLRFISRKFDDYGPSTDPTRTQDQIIRDSRESQRKWGEWYKSVRPDGELIEQ